MAGSSGGVAVTLKPTPVGGASTVTDGTAQGGSSVGLTGTGQGAEVTVTGLAAGTHTISLINRGPGPVAVDAIVATP